MTAWRNMNEGCIWAVKLDVRDLGGHLDVTLRAVADTLNNRVKIATTQVPAVGALPLGFRDGALKISACWAFMVVKVLLYLLAHSVHFDLRLHVLSGPRSSP